MKKKSTKDLPKKTLSDVGERNFLQEIAYLVDNPVLRFNDDASAIQLPDDNILVINADMLVKRTDVLPGMTSEQMGRKAVTMSVSDIIAKGVKPIGCLASVAFPEDLEVDCAKKVIIGIKDQCDEYGIKYLGGDLNQGEDVIIDAISFGISNKESIIPRLGANVGDVLYTTGYFGLTKFGFSYLLENNPLPDELQSIVLESIYTPKAKIQYLSLFQKVKIKICMDSSDGLFVTLNDLSKINNMGIGITNLPIHPKLSNFLKQKDIKPTISFNPLDLVFSGGEEFELVFALSPKNESLLMQTAKELNLPLIKIGQFSDEFDDIQILHEDYKKYGFSKEGYEHFR